jgi:two-component system OmpR family response regulator
MRILIVEDDAKTAAFIVKGLQESGFAVDHAGDGEEGLYMAVAESYDILVVDIMLPKKDGLTLIAEVRAKKPGIPILILSAKRSVDDRVKGLQIGSDDYLTKPFAFSEFVARIQALLRRSSHCPEGHRLVVGDMVLDLLSHEVSRAEKKIVLNAKEFAVLEYLMRHSRELVTRTMLMEHVWNFDFDPGTNVVDVHVCRLRDKIDKGFAAKMIHTMRGAGYVFKDQA